VSDTKRPRRGKHEIGSKRPSTPPAIGRPIKLTPELQRQIVMAVESGNYIETAAAYAGVDKTTVYDWMRRGARGDRPEFVAFSHAMQKALAASEMRDLDIIGNAAHENWQAAAWRLERKFPERWGRKDRMSIQADVNAKVVFVDDLAEPGDEDSAE
jgi:transposase